MPLSGLLATVSAAELLDALEYLDHEPATPQRLDEWGGALLAAQLNPWRGEGQAPYTAAGLTPQRWGAVLPARSTVVAKIEAWAAGMAAVTKGR